jgi:hypothetical protein
MFAVIRWKVAPVEHVDLTGKAVIVVGANVGLGIDGYKNTSPR